jgi:hypothetical protein
MNLDLDEGEEAQLDELERKLKTAQKEASLAEGEEQEQTATRRQIETQEAIDDFWRVVAATQLPGVGDELRAWNAWRAAGGKRVEARAEFRA